MNDYVWHVIYSLDGICYSRFRFLFRRTKSSKHMKRRKKLSHTLHVSAVFAGLSTTIRGYSICTVRLSNAHCDCAKWKINANTHSHNCNTIRLKHFIDWSTLHAHLSFFVSISNRFSVCLHLTWNGNWLINAKLLCVCPSSTLLSHVKRFRGLTI